MKIIGVFRRLATNPSLPKTHAHTSLGLVGFLVVVNLLPGTAPDQTAEPTVDPLAIAAFDHLLSPAATQKPAPAPEPAETDPRTYAEVRSGDNLSLIFDRVGLSPQDVYRVANSSGDNNILTRLYPGYTLAFDITEGDTLQELEVIRSALESYRFSRNSSGGFEAEHIVRSPELVPVYKKATINSSLFLAAQRGGIPAALTLEIAGIFGGVVDFMLDTRAGDSFDVLYEERHVDGQFVENGPIKAVRYTNQGRTYTALRYENAAGEIDYYNPEGESMRKVFLRNPVDFTRISSDFNLARRHPILNTIRAHKGTDYAAPRGTPVVATSDGRVMWAARNGSFGKLVVIRHGSRFETKYAHLTDYARGVQVGSRVAQGQVIGYVGATGGATGPHLHYEFLMDGVHRNARRIHAQLPKADSIAPEEMERFRNQTQPILAQLDSLSDAPAQQLASNSAD